MSATETTTTSPTVQLLTKLREVAEAIPFVEKRGQNTGVGGGYAFVQSVDVVRDVRHHLLARKVVVIPGSMNARHEVFHTKGGATAFLTTVDLVYRFTDSETGAVVEVPWVGTGVDTGGDKGIWKAYTGGLKYALLNLFLLPTTNDPEHDALTVADTPASAPAPATTVDKDAERPAAPPIPLDRAKSIADAAVAATIASWGEDGALVMEPVLKAQLATVGVTKVGQLNVDQAEAVEAFIADEHRANLNGAA